MNKEQEYHVENCPRCSGGISNCRYFDSDGSKYHQRDCQHCRHSNSYGKHGCTPCYQLEVDQELGRE